MDYNFQTMPAFDIKKAAVSAATYKPIRPQSNNGKVYNKFWEELKLDAIKQPILFLAGSYTSLIDGIKKPWKEYLVHKTAYIKGKQQKEIVCTAGIDPYNKQPCVGCYYYDNGPKKENPWYPKVTVKNSVLSLAMTHDNIPYTKNGKQSFIKERCIGKTCKLCSEYGKPTLNSRLMKLVLTGTHFSQLIAQNKNLLSKCSGCGFTIVLNDFSCPKCSVQLLNVADSRYSEEYLEQFANTPIHCTCGNEVIPQEGLDCGYDEEGAIKESDKCPLEFPIRMDIFNTVLPISKSGEKQQSKLDFGDRKSILENSLIKYTHISKLPLTELLSSALSVNNGSLFDLDKETITLSVEDQAATLEVENPYANMSTEMPSNIAVSQIPTGNFPVKFNNMAS